VDSFDRTTGGRARREHLRQAYDRDVTPAVVTADTTARGILEIADKGFGFLRTPENNYRVTNEDMFVSPNLIRRYRLKPGLEIEARVGPPKKGKGGAQVVDIVAIQGVDAEEYRGGPDFASMTVIDPRERIRLETVPEEISMRILDLMTPIGKGTRGLIVAAPRTGKTVLLQKIANAVATNHPEIALIVLLVDERPEEVTAMRRSVKGEVIASSNDMDLKNHVRISTLAIEKAKRMVEHGRDVVVLLDSITRLSRAFNNYVGNSGRTMSGGVDSRALEVPRKMFAAARNCEGGGSLTIIATALIDTGSRMDDLIFQEFKGTGNMEMVLDRTLADQRIFPALDVRKSGTRKEELLLGRETTDAIARLRREIADLKLKEVMEALISAMKRHRSNAELLAQLGAMRI